MHFHPSLGVIADIETVRSYTPVAMNMNIPIHTMVELYIETENIKDLVAGTPVEMTEITSPSEKVGPETPTENLMKQKRLHSKIVMFILTTEMQ